MEFTNEELEILIKRVTEDYNSSEEEFDPNRNFWGNLRDKLISLRTNETLVLRKENLFPDDVDTVYFDQDRI